MQLRARSSRSSTRRGCCSTRAPSVCWWVSGADACLRTSSRAGACAHLRPTRTRTSCAHWTRCCPTRPASASMRCSPQPQRAARVASSCSTRRHTSCSSSSTASALLYLLLYSHCSVESLCWSSRSALFCVKRERKKLIDYFFSLFSGLYSPVIHCRAPEPPSDREVTLTAAMFASDPHPKGITSSLPCGFFLFYFSLFFSN